MRFILEPALSLVPEARAPPKGCCPTTAPVGLSLMYRLPAACRSAPIATRTAPRSRAKIAPVSAYGDVRSASASVSVQRASA